MRWMKEEMSPLVRKLLRDFVSELGEGRGARLLSGLPPGRSAGVCLTPRAMRSELLSTPSCNAILRKR